MRVEVWVVRAGVWGLGFGVPTSARLSNHVVSRCLLMHWLGFEGNKRRALT